MTQINYPLGGFNNLGATPGIMNTSTPMTNLKQPAPVQNTGNGLDLSMFNKNLASGALSQTAPVKKVKTSDGTEIHFDNTLGTNKGMLDNSNKSGTNATANGSIVNANGAVENINKPAPTPTPVPTVGSISTGLVGTGQTAQDIANNAQKAYEEVGRQGARGQAGYLSTGTTPVAQGNAAIVANTTANQQKAIMEGADIGLQGVTTQQAGLNQAGQLVSPTGNFPFVFNPATGQFTSGAGGATNTTGAPTLTYNPQQDANSLATSVIANKVPYNDAVSAMGYAGTIGQGLLTTAITSQGGNLTNIQAQQAATQQNINTTQTAATTAVAQANSDIYSKALANVAQLQAQLNTVDQLGNLLVKTGNIAGVSPTDSQLANKSINQVQNQFSQNANFISTMATLKEKIGGLLAIGGTGLPTQVASDMNDVMSGNLAFSKIPSLLNQIQQEGSIILGNQQTIAANAAANLKNVGGTMSNTPTGNTQSGVTQSGISYTITQK